MALLVNGEKIKDSAVRREVKLLRPDYERAFANQDPREREAQLLEWSKENVIERVLIKQEVKKNGEKIPVAEVESALTKLKEQYEDLQQLYEDFEAEDDGKLKEQVELLLMVGRKLKQVCEDLPMPSQNAVREYYEEHQDQFKSDEQIRVAHIVKYIDFQTDEETAYNLIRQAHDELENGMAFEAVVDRYIDCVDSGGDLGCISRGQMAEEFDDVVFNLDVGQVSGIFRTRFGFHIAKVYEREPAVVSGFEEVKGRIKDALKERLKEEAIENFVDDLRSRAEIEQV